MSTTDTSLHPVARTTVQPARGPESASPAVVFGAGLSSSPVELGYTRNLLCTDYATPYPGVVVDCPAAESQANQPPLCTIDLEGSCEPCQPQDISGRTQAAAPPTYRV